MNFLRYMLHLNRGLPKVNIEKWESKSNRKSSMEVETTESNKGKLIKDFFFRRKFNF
jgi:hypothetical protein